MERFMRMSNQKKIVMLKKSTIIKLRKLVSLQNILLLSILSILTFNTIYDCSIDNNIDDEIATLCNKVDSLERLIYIRTPEVDVYKLELNKDNFFRVCAYYNIQFDSIVYRQAVLESGNFSSQLCRTHNNFLGLYDSRNRDYYKFDHWSTCIKAYRDFVQYKYNKEKYGCDYYNFLKKLPYAEDSLYIQKLKGLF